MPDRAEGCAFCAIAGGDAEANLVLEDAGTVAFLDRRPLFPGHSLLIPREHHVSLPDLPAEQIAPLFANARLLAEAIPAAMNAEGSFVAINNVVSQSVPHLHVHIVPRVRKDGLRGFFWPRTKYAGDDHAAETAAAIRASISDRVEQCRP